jgi:hypothetical protein
MQKQDYDRTIYFERTRSMCDKLNSDVARLLNLQKFTIYKSRMKLDLALSAFKVIIAKNTV